MTARKIALLPVVLASAVACTSADTGDTGDNTKTDNTIPSLQDGLEDFNIGYALDEAYWYSRYNLGSLVMKSGMGKTFMPDMTMVGQMVTMVSDTQSTAVPPMNPALLERVYNTATPTWPNADDGSPGDFADERWETAIDTKTSAATLGWTILKETQWARLFHVDAHFGAPGSTSGATSLPGAQQRFSGMALYVSALKQAMAWMDDRMSPSGDYDLTNVGDAYIVLAALSDLADMTAAATMDHSSSNRYAQVANMMATSMSMTDGAALAAMILSSADDLYATLSTPTSARDLSLAIQGLTWYAMASSSGRTAAKADIATYASSLISATKNGVIDQAYAARGLLEAYRVAGSTADLQGATDAYEAMLAAFEFATGRFTGVNTYSVDDVAVIFGAINSTILHGQPADEDVAITFIEYVFESIVNLSGLQTSAPPVAALPEYERKLNDLFHRYPTLPMPRAGATHRAPVMAAAVTWTDGSGWSSDTSFDSAGAMHLSNEFIWTHADEVNGFPVVP